MILADTSAWVEYDRATGTPTDQRMVDLIAGGGPLAVTEPVLMEVLVGAVDERRASQLRSLLRRFSLLAFECPGDFDGAVAIHRRCRAQGVTPRGVLDCMIGAVAVRTGSSLLTRDQDLVRIAGAAGIELDRA
jgi:hypothetical protein